VIKAAKVVFSILCAFLYYVAGFSCAVMQGVGASSRARISPWAKFRGAISLGEVSLARSVTVGEGSYMSSGTIANTVIGKYVSIGSEVIMGMTEHKHNLWTTSPYEARAKGLPTGFTDKPVQQVIIEDGAWIGARVTILQGVRLGRGSVVAAGAVVTKEVPAYEIWAEVPARRIGKRSDLTNV
jgi:acetyltransferase-like isoleucine patch superfamily enzyme